MRWSKKTSKLRVTDLCAWNSPGTGEFPAQMASNAGNVSIWWRHHVWGRHENRSTCTGSRLNANHERIDSYDDGEWFRKLVSSLQWRHNGGDGVSHHHPYECLLNRSFRRRSKKTAKLRVTGLCVVNSPGPVNSPHKGPVTRKMFPFNDVIMWWWWVVAKARLLITMT